MSNAVQESPRPQYLIQGEPRRPFNGMAISAFVVVFFASVVGLVLGYVALNQLKQSDESGHGFALAAVILGWIGTLGAIVLGGLFVVGTVLLKLF